MKVLYCIPVFFEYRLTYFKELVRLFHGDFSVMYSPLRYRICRKSELCEQIKADLGDSAVPFETEHVFDCYVRKWDTEVDITRSKIIPVIWGMGKAIARCHPDILITEGYFQWTPLVLLYGLLHQVPVYMGYERTPHTERHVGFIRRWQRKLFNRFFAGFLVNGQETQAYLQSLGVEESRIHRIGMSADAGYMREHVAQFRGTAACAELRAGFTGNPASRGLIFLFTGAIAASKGVPHLLAAWKKHLVRHPEDHLILVGSGNMSEELENEYRDVASVHLTGRIPYNDVYKYYGIADVFILPTLWDNWSLVVPEAMSCGLPVATSIYNGCHAELIQEGVNGYTFDPLKEETMVEVLHRFHAADLAAMGQASVEMEKPFNTENCALRLYSTLTRLHQK